MCTWIFTSLILSALLNSFKRVKCLSYKWKCTLQNEVLLESGEIKYSLRSS